MLRTPIGEVIWYDVEYTGEPPADTDGLFDSEMMTAGGSYEFTFTEAGSYNYYCTFHPWMVGTVNVE